MNSIQIHLGGGRIEQFSPSDNGSPSCFDIAKLYLGEEAKDIVGTKINGILSDLSVSPCLGERVEFLFLHDHESFPLLNHSAAHLLAQAVMNLFPATKFVTGPATDQGFFYDFDSPHTFTPDDFSRLESEMQSLAREEIKIQPAVQSYSILRALFQNQPYKINIIDSLELTHNSPGKSYKQGNFIDLCSGPHVPHTGFLEHIKILKVAGAYYKGDEKNKMLQRIYGVCCPSADDLKEWLDNLERAKEFDHRILARKMKLFHFQEEGKGSVFWHSSGTRIFQTVIKKLREKTRENGYEEVMTPLILQQSLWKRSGHWDKFGAGKMFRTETEEGDYLLKPMNCPGHIQIFNQGLKSYRDLPLRLAEFGICHRNEPSGTLHGLMRLRCFTQDDAHIFCTSEELEDEICRCLDQVKQIYSIFGFKNFRINLATRPEMRIGADELWDSAEERLVESLQRFQASYQVKPGEGAFYGPKIEFLLSDSLNRSWQCGTVQVDFSMTNCLNAYYVDTFGKKQNPILVHRAILGSIERFIGILLEHYRGDLPLWLAPIKLIFLPLGPKHHTYCEICLKKFAQHGIDGEIDLRQEKLGYKIREATVERIPYLAIIGDREVEQESLTIRSRNGTNLGEMKIADFLERLEAESIPPQN